MPQVAAAGPFHVFNFHLTLGAHPHHVLHAFRGERMPGAPRFRKVRKRTACGLQSCDGIEDFLAGLRNESRNEALDEQ